jgi:phosphate transport system substrate-binding protein
MNVLRNAVILVVACVATAGCHQSKPRLTTAQVQSSITELELSTESYPRVDGSTSAEPLQRVIACKVFDAPVFWFHSEKDDTQHLIASDYDELYGAEGKKADLCKRINELTESHGTDKAYLNLIEGNADLILVARAPSPDELQLLKQGNVELDCRPVALDAFIFLVNEKNTVTSLTVAQIRDIYSGAITNWRQVGGIDAKITPYQRTRNSGSQELMRPLVMKDRKMIHAPELLTGTLMHSPFLAIGDDVHGIGYSVYYYGEFMAPLSPVKSCALNGVLPTTANIRNRKYPLVTEVFVVVRRNLSPDHSAIKLRDWLLTPAGQSVVGESGYVPILEVPDSD